MIAIAAVAVLSVVAAAKRAQNASEQKLKWASQGLQRKGLHTATINSKRTAIFNYY